MSLQIWMIRDIPYVYWKVGDRRISLGKKDEVLRLVRIALSRKGRDVSVVRKTVHAFGRVNLAMFLLQTPTQMREELLTI